MKKIFVFLISVFIVCQVSGQWRVGPRLGVNFTTLSGKWNDDDDTKNKWVVGPTAGATAGYSFNELFSLNADLLYIHMGNKTVNTYEDIARQAGATTYTFKEYFNCIQLAFLAQIMFGTNISYFFFAGPFITYKFGGCGVADDGTTLQKYKLVWGIPPARSSNPDYYIDPEYNRRFTPGIYLGGGVGKDLGRGKLTVDARFGIGLIDLNKFESKEERKDARENGYKAYRGLNIAIMVAYLIPFGE